MMFAEMQRFRKFFYTRLYLKEILKVVFGKIIIIIITTTIIQVHNSKIPNALKNNAVFFRKFNGKTLPHLT